MGDTLSTVLSSWRAANQTNSILEKLKIGEALYDIKDPAVEALASAVETRLSAVENKTIREAALEKAQNAAKFATSVEQGTDGQITVTYSDAETTDVKRTATAAIAAVPAVLYTAEEAAAYNTEHSLSSEDEGYVHEGDVKIPAVDGQIALAGTTTEATLIEIAKAIAAEQAARAAGDTAAESAAKAYVDQLVNNLAGANWADNAKKVQEIIEELENSDNANAWATAIDKLAGLNINYTQAEADAYNANLTDAISTETVLTAEQAAALNALSGVSSTEYTAGSSPQAVDAALYNSKLEGAVSTSTVKTPQTVKQYVDAKFAEAQAAASGGITDLDAVVSGNLDNNDDVTTGHKVGVKVTEVDGVITNVTVVENDIASAQDLEDLTDTVEEHSEVTAAALVDLDSRLTTVETNVGGIDLTTKANKAAITTGNINNWTTSYNSSSHQLEWTNTETSVYVPVSGQSL